LYSSSDATVRNNIFDYSRPPAGGCSAAMISLQNGSNTRIRDNSIDGGWNGVPVLSGCAAGSVGADDGIVLNVETGDTIDGNTIRNTWDAGIEGVSTLSATSITNNIILNSWAGIGSYHSTNWQGNVVTGNSIRATLLMFVFN